MDIMKLIEFAGVFFLGQFIISAFIKSRQSGGSSSKPTEPFTTIMRYVGFMIIFAFIGLIAAIYLIEFDLVDGVPPLTLKLILAGTGLLVGVWTARKFPGALR